MRYQSWMCCVLFGAAALLDGPRPMAFGQAVAPAASQPASSTLRQTGGAFDVLAKQMPQTVRCVLQSGALRLDRNVWPTMAQLRNNVYHHAINGGDQWPVDPATATKMADAYAAREQPWSHPGLLAVKMLAMDMGGKYEEGSELVNGAPVVSVAFSTAGVTGRGTLRGEKLEVVFTEEQAPSRVFTVTDDGKGLLSLIVKHPGGDRLSLVQQARGPLAIALTIAGKTKQLAGPSFADLYQHNRQAMDEQVLPVLRGLGVLLTATPDAPGVDAAALAELRPLTAEYAQAWQAQVKALDSDDFNARETASSNLSSHYDLFRAQIAARAEAPAVSPEARHRMQLVLAEHPQDAPARAVVLAYKLLDDRSFLMGLMESAAEADRVNVAARLEHLTGQKLGPDIGAWKDYFASHPAP